MDDIIYSSHGPFVVRRQFLNEVLIANECLDARKREGDGVQVGSGKG